MPARPFAGIQVLRDRKLREEVVSELLIDNLDSSLHRVLWLVEGNQGPIDLHGALVGRVGTGDHPSQRRLAGSILAKQGHDLATVDGEVDPFEDLVFTKLLADPPQLQLHGHRS